MPKKYLALLVLFVVVMFSALDFYYWGTLDKFAWPLRHFSGDTSLYATNFNPILNDGRPSGNPFFQESVSKYGRFFVFGELLSLVPFALPIVWWMLLLKVLVAVSSFFLVAALFREFIPDRARSYLFSLAFVFLYGAIAFKAGSALSNWYFPWFLAGYLLLVRVHRDETDHPRVFWLSLFSVLLFSVHPIYFAFGNSLMGLVWLHKFYKRPSKELVLKTAIWFVSAISVLLYIFLPFFYTSDPALAEASRDMAYRNTALTTRFPFLFLFGIRYLLLLVITLYGARQAREKEEYSLWSFLALSSLVAFMGLNSYVLTGRYFLNDHFPFFEDFIAIPLALLVLRRGVPGSPKVLKLIGRILFFVASLSVFIIWQYLKFKPVYFGNDSLLYLAHLIVASVLIAPEIRVFLERHRDKLLGLLLGIAIVHMAFITPWDDKFWLPRHREVQQYREVIEIMRTLPRGVVLADPNLTNLALLYTHHKAYWSPIAYHDVVSTRELHDRWIEARYVLPEEPEFGGETAAKSVFGSHNNKCREYKRGIYLEYIAKLGWEGPYKAICSNPAADKAVEMSAEFEAYQAAGVWKPTYQLTYLIVEKDKNVLSPKALTSFIKYAEDPRFVVYMFKK